MASKISNFSGLLEAKVNNLIFGVQNRCITSKIGAYPVEGFVDIQN
jgi:hypothetical protein